MAADESKWRRELRQELERDFRGKQRKRLAELRKAVSEAKKAKRARLKAVTRGCQKARAANAARIRRERLEARERINAERDQLRAEAAAACGLRRGKVGTKASARVTAAERELQQERGRQHSYRVHTRPAKLGQASRAPRGRAAEKRRESDEEVQRNLPAELVAVWEKVKKRIKPSERRSRTEAFLEWVHDHSAEVQAIEAQSAEEGVERWIAEERAAQADYDQEPGELADAELLRRYDEMRTAEGDVPF